MVEHAYDRPSSSAFSLVHFCPAIRTLSKCQCLLLVSLSLSFQGEWQTSVAPSPIQMRASCFLSFFLSFSHEAYSALCPLYFCAHSFPLPFNRTSWLIESTVVGYVSYRVRLTHVPCAVVTSGRGQPMCILTIDGARSVLLSFVCPRASFSLSGLVPISKWRRCVDWHALPDRMTAARSRRMFAHLGRHVRRTRRYLILLVVDECAYRLDCRLEK